MAFVSVNFFDRPTPPVFQPFYEAAPAPSAPQTAQPGATFNPFGDDGAFGETEADEFAPQKSKAVQHASFRSAVRRRASKEFSSSADPDPFAGLF